jgi:hypothetical protein
MSNPVALVAAAAGLDGVSNLAELFDRARSCEASTDAALALYLARYIRESETLGRTIRECRRAP